MRFPTPVTKKVIIFLVYKTRDFQTAQLFCSNCGFSDSHLGNLHLFGSLSTLFLHGRCQEVAIPEPWGLNWHRFYALCHQAGDKEHMSD